jgi:predicted amidohydrolase
MSERFEVVRENEAEETPPAGTVRMAAVQTEPRIAEPGANVDGVVAAMERAAALRVRLAAFTECALTGYCFDDSREAEAAAIPADSPHLGRIADASARTGVTAAVGYLERTRTGVANAVSIVGGEGIVAHYRKTHLPHLGADRFTEPGEDPFRVFEAAGLRVGLLICYDASFPEASRLLALAGADLILLPTNWPEEAEVKGGWLPNTRAYENVVYFASVNRIGRERGFAFHGRSRICDPTGASLVEGPADREAILVADLDPARARTKRIVRRDEYWVDRIGQRRRDLYRLAPADPEGNG